MKGRPVTWSWSSLESKLRGIHPLNRNLLPLMLVIAAALFAVGFASGRLSLYGRLAEIERALAATPEPIILPEEAEMPTRDVTGADVEGLPRFPGSVRVEYRHVILGDLEEMEVEYVAAAELDDVHDFYRNVFDEEGWIVADLGIFQGEWTFFVVSGEREAVVELEARQSLVEVEIEVMEPIRD